MGSVMWRQWCESANYALRGVDTLEVRLEQGRTHRVTVSEGPRGVELKACVVSAGFAATIKDLPMRVCRYGRSVPDMTFEVDAAGCVVAHSWLANSTLECSVFLSALQRLAKEADRLEYLLTGRDEH